jgi:putative DNA-invertase from lambdoid prophage Rac
MQLFELRQYVERRGWNVFHEYVDTGFSGAQSSRPQIDQLLADARRRRFDAVLVWKLDRWGRSVAHCVRTIQELVSLDVRFLSVSEGIDTGVDNPMSRFMLHILAAFAEMEREIIRERVRAGQPAARAKGKPFGRPKRIFRRDEALRLRTEGKSWRYIARTHCTFDSVRGVAKASSKPILLSHTAVAGSKAQGTFWAENFRGGQDGRERKSRGCMIGNRKLFRLARIS